MHSQCFCGSSTTAAGYSSEVKQYTNLDLKRKLNSVSSCNVVTIVFYLKAGIGSAVVYL